MDATGIILWAIGILIAIALAFFGAKRISKNRAQKLNAKGGSTAIQAGRDVNINDR
jgi:hypothetical protein